MKIIYYNNCWFTNVGEAFIDIGAMEILKGVFNNGKIACASAMTNYYINMMKNNTKTPFDYSEENTKMTSSVQEYLECDYVVLAGMFATNQFLRSEDRKVIDCLVAKGSKVIFLGLGGLHYNDVERAEFIQYLNSIKPQLVVTRDDKTFEMYKDYCNIRKGIDCAFWVNDVFNPKGFATKKYDVVSFNRSKEPYVFSNWNNDVIRPWHMQYHMSLSKCRDNMLISDTPYDYLTLYANANRVYTDLVHATIVALMYDVPVKYWYIDERCNAFYALEGLQNNDGFLSVPGEQLEKQKRKIVETISCGVGM